LAFGCFFRARGEATAAEGSIAGTFLAREVLPELIDDIGGELLGISLEEGARGMEGEEEGGGIGGGGGGGRRGEDEGPLSAALLSPLGCLELIQKVEKICEKWRLFLYSEKISLTT
jgi:hypothetical protein